MRLIPRIDERNLSLLEHLEELRTRLIRCAAALVIGFILGYALSGPTVDLLLKPVRESGLVPRDQLVAKVDVQPDGGLKFRALSKLHPVQTPAVAEDETTTWTAVIAGGRANIARLEFFEPGGEVPAAVFESSSRAGVVYIRPMDPFLIRLKAAIILAVLFALPVILYQIYAFIAPGLLPTERRAIMPMLAGALLLFPIGALFAYYLLKFALIFFAQYAAAETYMFNDIRAYMSLALTTMLAFGVLFELPIVVLLLTRLGIVSVETLAAKRRIIFVLLLVVCAIATPTGDPFTLAAMAFPLYGLFELSLLIGRVTERRARAAQEAQ